VNPTGPFVAVLLLAPMVLSRTYSDISAGTTRHDSSKGDPNGAEEFRSTSGKVRVVVESTSNSGHGDVHYRVHREGKEPREVRSPVRLEEVAVLETGEFAGFGYNFDESVPPQRYRVLAIFDAQGECLLDQRTPQTHPPDSGYSPKAFAVAASDACLEVAFAVYDPEGVSRRRLLVYSLPKAERILDCQVVPPGVNPVSPRFSATRKGEIVNMHWIGKRPLLLLTWDQALPHLAVSSATDEGDAFTILDPNGRAIWTARLASIPDATVGSDTTASIVLADFDSGRAIVERGIDSFALRLQPKDKTRKPVEFSFDVRVPGGGGFIVERR
jgi:hypothetical protein